MTLKDEIHKMLLTRRIGWIVDEGRLWPPSTSHGSHKFDGGCAVCRTDESVALDAMVTAIADFVEGSETKPVTVCADPKMLSPE